MSITSLNKTKFATAALAALCFAVAAPSLAAAQEIDPTTSQYGNELTQIETGTNVCINDDGTVTTVGGSGTEINAGDTIEQCNENGEPPAPTISTGPPPPGPGDPGAAPTGLGGNVGPLPFTGFDVIAMAAVALAVAGLGLALQRAVSREPGDGVS